MRLISPAICVLPFLLAAAPAQAQTAVIDGSWCSAEGLRMSISGARVVTPRGARAVGRNDNTTFFYIAPDADLAPGEPVALRLHNDAVMYSKIGAEAARQQIVWRRCAKMA